MSEFLRRALEECARYGDDPWLFVRELVQNARDAGACRVELTTGRSGGVEWVECADDGTGMSLDEARRYLLTLYASSKHSDGWAGRFGIGFWTVLRFDPASIRVLSAPPGGDGWELSVDGALEHPQLSQAPRMRGTRVLLERPASDVDLSAAVRAAVAETAPFPTCRHRERRPLTVLVDGVPAGRSFSLPPPSLSFTRPGLRGVVALAETPRVELFAYGLRVREATALDDLLADGPVRTEPTVPGSAPAALLDSDRLEVLLARGDARDDRALRRLVRVARSELARLIGAELDRVAPRSLAERLLNRLAAAARPVRVVLSGLALATAGLALGWLLSSGAPVDRARPSPGAGERRAPYRDPSAGYHGPENDALPSPRVAADVTYRPARDMLLGVLRLESLDSAPPRLASLPLRAAAGSACASACVELSLGLDGGGRIRLPLPPGHAVDPASVRLDGRPLDLYQTPSGAPVVVLPPGVSGRLSYRAGAAPAAPFVPHWPALPPVLADRAAECRGLSPEAVASRASALVQRLVRYRAGGPRLSPARDVVEAALAAGEGDCDVQNTVLASVLSAAGVPARLAVGYVGRDGRVLPVLHAWVEYLDGDRVAVADASRVVGGSAPPPSPPGPTPHGESRWPALAVAATVAGGLLALLAALALVLRGRRRSFAPGGSEDAADLLRGILVRERPWPGAEAVERRRLAPLLEGRRISLRRARSLAAAGRLAASRRGTPAARAVARSGVPVVDAARPAGRVVSEALGLPDLDVLLPLLRTAGEPSVASALNRAVALSGGGWRLLVAPGSAVPPTVLPAGVSRAGDEVVLLGEQSSLWRAAAEQGTQRPGAARFLLADAVLHVLRPPGPARRMALAGFARGAVREAAGE